MLGITSYWTIASLAIAAVACSLAQAPAGSTAAEAIARVMTSWRGWISALLFAAAVLALMQSVALPALAVALLGGICCSAASAAFNQSDS